MEQQVMKRAIALPNSSYACLTRMLNEGWQIEPPIYVRPTWQSLRQRRNGDTYHFILRREDKLNLISLQDSPQLQRFLQKKGLAVDRL
jgi:hypothetical protein